MAKLGVTEIHESLGFKNYGNSSYRTRAVFHYEPLLRLYKLEIPSLFGRLMRDEGIFLERTDPDLFQTELEEVLTELGPLIWPDLGQGSRDHLLKPIEGTRYTSDLIYPRDKNVLIMHLRNLILSKHVRAGTDFNALIEKRHKDANLKIFNNANHGDAQTRTRTTKRRRKSTKGSAISRDSRQISLTDESFEPSEILGDSEDSVIRTAERRQVKAKRTGAPLRVALRLCHATSSGERSSVELSKPYGNFFIDNTFDSAARCFDHVDQQTGTRCTYIEFHPPEDMSLQNRIRIERNSEQADKIFDQVVTMLREARKFPGEPSYRTVEVEFGADKATDD